jgi:hypothetical protein
MAVSSDGGRLFSPGVDIKTGNPLQPLQILSEEAARLPPLTGTGSPEGIIESKQGRFYINIAGGVGTILYVKRLDDIAGNRKTGWTLV